MPILRLAYSTQFLIAVIAIFVLWSEVGGQSHLDLLPWPVKLTLGLAAAYGVVRATAASVSGDRAWNGQTARWLGLTLALLLACGYATYYAHLNLEETDEADQEPETTISKYEVGTGAPGGGFLQYGCSSGNWLAGESACQPKTQALAHQRGTDAFVFQPPAYS